MRGGERGRGRKTKGEGRVKGLHINTKQLVFSCAIAMYVPVY